MAKDSKENNNDNNKVPDDVDVPVPPDGGYGWIVLIAAFVSYLFKKE